MTTQVELATFKDHATDQYGFKNGDEEPQKDAIKS